MSRGKIIFLVRIKLNLSETRTMGLSFILCLVTMFTVSLACDNFFIPSELDGCDFESLLLVNPSSGFVITEENCGLEVDKETFYEQPFVFYSDAVSDMKYTLVMVDHDNPLAVDDNLYLHWLVTDIDGQSLTYGLGIYSGNVIAGSDFKPSLNFIIPKVHFSAYDPPDPSQYSCVHRYSIYIYEQHFNPLEFPEVQEYRAEFNINDFISNVIPNGGICGPVASIEFKSRY